MSDQEQPNFSAIDLPITLYLNQRLTFDLLAILQGGFSSFSKIQTTPSGETTTNVDGMHITIIFGHRFRANVDAEEGIYHGT